MSPVPSAILMVIAAACAAPAAGPGASVEPKTLLVHEAAVTLGETPTAVALPLGKARRIVAQVARDPRRALVLRVEGIAVDRPPDIIYEVLVDGKPVGPLSFYGAEEAKGRFIAAFPIDEAASGGGRELHLVFAPQGKPVGRVRFSRLRLVEENLQK